MKDKQYIMVGAPIITKEIFRNVLRPLDNYTFKPNGGFWASEYTGEESISDWYKYLMYAEEVAGQKSISQSTIFTLKEDSKILTIDNLNTVLELSKKYPSYHHLLGYYYNDKVSRTEAFDYEKLSQDYDGIYVNLKNLGYGKTCIFQNWNVNTLLLFNLDCIKEYQTAPIITSHGYPYIETKKVGAPQKVETASTEHQVLSHLSEDIYQELINKYTTPSFEDYHDYFTTIIKTSSNVIEIMLKEEYKKVNEIQNYLQSKGMQVRKEIIITNIVLNNLTNYLIQDIERIKTLPKSKVKTLTWYSINK